MKQRYKFNKAKIQKYCLKSYWKRKLPETFKSNDQYSFCDILDRLELFFNGDMRKVHEWLGTPNPGLGNIRPIMLVDGLRIKKLWNFVYSSVGDNKH